MRDSFLFLVVCLSCVGCVASRVRVQDALLGADSRFDELVASASGVERATDRATVRVTRVLAADWAVERAGVIDLDDPRAARAGLEPGLEQIQIYFYVIDHPTRGRFLIDSGVAASFRELDTAPVTSMIREGLNLDGLVVREDMKAWVEANGPIAGIFLTHSHIDHIMGLPDIPASVPVYFGPGETRVRELTHLFTRRTVDAMIDPERDVFQWRFEPGLDDRFEGILDVFGDGSFYVLYTPGHTAGSVSFLAITDGDPVLMVGDASHTDWGWRHCVPPGTYNQDLAKSRESLIRLRSLEDAIPGLTVYLGHQPHDVAAPRMKCARD